MTPIESGGRFMNRREVAEIFGVNPVTIDRWARAGRFGESPTVTTPAGQRKYKRAVIMEYAQAGGFTE